MTLKCPYCSASKNASDNRSLIVSRGYFLRKEDQTKHQRFQCKPCKKSFSLATFHPCYRQKKRTFNVDLFKHFASGYSQRRLAINLKLNRKTVVRKFLFLGLMAHHLNQHLRSADSQIHEMEFDDLETFEHSKLKPLSVTMAVESHTRKILGFRVAQMPAKGLLVQKSLKKYGKRADHRRLARESLFKDLQGLIHPCALVKSDENPHYVRDLKKAFPRCTHSPFKGRRGCVVGQGELKAGGFDPIFSLNHSFAMMRANINRLFRRTWNTTKLASRLAVHIELYVLFHNQVLIRPRIREV